MFINICAEYDSSDWLENQITSAKELSRIFMDDENDDEIINIKTSDTQPTTPASEIQAMASAVVVNIYATAPNGAVVYVDHHNPAAVNIILTLMSASVCDVDGIHAKYLIVDGVYYSDPATRPKRYFEDSIQPDPKDFYTWREYLPTVMNTGRHFMSFAKPYWTDGTDPTDIYRDEISLDHKLHPEL